MTVVDLAFGRGHLSLDLPADVDATVVTKRPAHPLADPDAAVADALRTPIGSPPLAELARGRASACIVVCDITRPVPNGLFLRPLITTLLDSGIPLDKITILVATGLHRPNLGDELAELIGDPWVLAHVRIVNHDARADADLVDLGPTPTRGTPVVLNRLFVDADLRIVTGLVEPHFMAGWSGGRKVIAPGVAGQATIRTFHSHRFMADPFAVQCNLENNPLHTEQLQIAAKVGEVYALNTVLDQDRRLLMITFGDLLASHATAVAYAEEISRVKVGRRFDTVITSSAGAPLDRTYYQTVKCMVTPLDILAPGGTLIVASECAEGLGSAEFARSQRQLVDLGPDAFLAELSTKRLADVDEWQSQMQLRSQAIGRVQLYSPALSAEQRALTGVDMIDDLAAAVTDAVARSGDPAVAVIPEGPYVVPVS